MQGFRVSNCIRFAGYALFGPTLGVAIVLGALGLHSGTFGALGPLGPCAPGYLLNISYELLTDDDAADAAMMMHCVLLLY